MPTAKITRSAPCGRPGLLRWWGQARQDPRRARGASRYTKERVTPSAGQIEPAPTSGYLLLQLLGLSGWSAAVLPDRKSDEGGIVLSVRRLGRAPIERRGPNVAAVVVEVYREALQAA